MRMVWLRVVPALVVTLGSCADALAQEPAKPGPEHARLKEMEGTWDATVKMQGAESKAVANYKMDLGGLWLTSTFQGDFGGMKFEGRGLDSYDPAKKKYVGVWVDSWSTAPMVMEGTFDKEKNIVTMIGEGPGPEGKPVKHRMVTKIKDKDTHDWTMYVVGPDGKEAEMLSITYKRRK